MRIAELEKIDDCWLMLAVFTERINLFLARSHLADHIETGDGLAHENEEIDIHEMPLREPARHLKTSAEIDMKLLVLVQAQQIWPEVFAE